MSYRGPVERHFEKRGIPLKSEPTRFWQHPWVFIILGALLLTVLAVAEALLVGYLPWSKVDQPGLWRFPASVFLVGILAGFCLCAEDLHWFGNHRKLVQTAAGLCVGLGITLLFTDSLVAALVGASVGAVAGYFGERLAEGL